MVDSLPSAVAAAAGGFHDRRASPRPERICVGNAAGLRDEDHRGAHGSAPTRVALAAAAGTDAIVSGAVKVGAALERSGRRGWRRQRCGMVAAGRPRRQVVAAAAVNLRLRDRGPFRVGMCVAVATVVRLREVGVVPGEGLAQRLGLLEAQLLARCHGADHAQQQHGLRVRRVPLAPQ